MVPENAAVVSTFTFQESVPGSIRDIREIKKPRQMLQRKHHIKRALRLLFLTRFTK